MAELCIWGINLLNKKNVNYAKSKIRIKKNALSRRDQ
jgi:hypothetical protein